MKRLPPLMRQAAFRDYWAAGTVSVLGDGVFSVALPLTAAVYLNADAAQMGYLGALTWLPTLLFSVHAGTWADRIGRHRAIMLTADLIRLALVACVPVSYALHLLSLAELDVIVFATGALSALFDVAEIALFATLVPPESYTEGQSLVFGGQSLATVVGPSLGSALVALLSAPVGLIADAASFLCSAALLSRLPSAVTPESRGRAPGSTVEGLRYIRRTPVIRTALAVTATANFFNVMFSALVVLYLRAGLHLTPGAIGGVLTATAAGGVIGAALAGRAARLAGLGPVLLAGSVLISAPLILVPLAAGPKPMTVTLIVLAVTGSGAGRSFQNVTVGSLFAMEVPGKMRSRVKGAYQTVSIGARPLGALLGGILATAAGLQFALLVAAIGGTLACLWLIRSPLLTYQPPATACRSSALHHASPSKNAPIRPQ